jgi:hypothetical protein
VIIGVHFNSIFGETAGMDCPCIGQGPVFFAGEISSKEVAKGNVGRDFG